MEPVGRRIQIETLANKTLAVGALSRAATLNSPRPPAWPPAAPASPPWAEHPRDMRAGALHCTARRPPSHTAQLAASSARSTSCRVTRRSTVAPRPPPTAASWRVYPHPLTRLTGCARRCLHLAHPIHQGTSAHIFWVPCRRRVHSTTSSRLPTRLAPSSAPPSHSAWPWLLLAGHARRAWGSSSQRAPARLFPAHLQACPPLATSLVHFLQAP